MRKLKSPGQVELKVVSFIDTGEAKKEPDIFCGSEAQDIQ